MNKLLKCCLIIMFVGLFPFVADSQVDIGVNINFPTGERYYYLQDVEAYYDNQTSMYIYLSGDRWTRVKMLPSSYRNFNFNTTNKVIIRDYTGNSPFYYYKTHKVKFPKGHYKGKNNSYWSVKEYKNQRKQAVKSHNNNHKNSKKNNDKKSKHSNNGKKGK